MIPAWLVTGAWRVLSFVVPIPVFVILAIAGWLYVDHHSAIREAVNDRVREMVAGAEIAALEAKISAQQQIAARLAEAVREAERRQAVTAAARSNLAARLAAIQTENEILNDDMADLLSRPVPGDCSVDADLARRLRGR